jgi:hypothetical protein
MPRFSLKWMLLAMVYAAIAAAAFTQRNWLYADLLWAVLMASVGYAVLLIIYARGERQARAAGFVVLAAGFLACLYLAPNAMPTHHLAGALPAPADEVSQVQYAYASPAITPLPASPPPSTYPSPYAPAIPPSIQPPLVAAPITIAYTGPVYFVFRFSAANAVAALSAGLVGCALGAVAYRQATSSDFAAGPVATR